MDEIQRSVKVKIYQATLRCRPLDFIINQSKFIYFLFFCVCTVYAPAASPIQVRCHTPSSWEPLGFLFISGHTL